MKILMVAIPNHHFFRWANQLEQSGYEVFWFDVSSNGSNSPQIPWVTQFTHWKLKWDFPFRIRIKKHLPALQAIFTKVNEVDVNKAFKTVLEKVNPDVIHCFEMKLSGLPILKTLLLKNTMPVIYSSWGSDLYYFKELGTPEKEVKSFLKRINYLITDCKRDIEIAKKNGFNQTVLGVFPGNGGLEIDKLSKLPIKERSQIIFKGYQFDVGEAVQILKAIELLPAPIQKTYRFVVYSADKEVEDYISSSLILKTLDFLVLKRQIKIPNDRLIALMGESCLHIGNNLSDGMPNSMLEAMMQGCFPIQSNPGNASAELITHGCNGFLIENPFDYKKIAQLIEQALLDDTLRLNAASYNFELINKKYNRNVLKTEIVNLYQSTQIT